MSLIVSVLLGSTAVAASSTSEAARAVVVRYYAALEQRDYGAAYRAWGDDGRASGKRYAQFVRGFANTRHTSVEAGAPSLPEGGAGSLYVTVPVVVRATLKNGTTQRFAGTYILRRVNDVEGATPEQLKWHIGSASLRRR